MKRLPRIAAAAAAVAAAAAWMACADAARANPIDDAVRQTEDGRVRFHYEARPGVYGDGHSTTIHSRSGRDGDEDMWPYQAGPVHVVLRVRDGEVSRVKHAVGGSWRSLPRNTNDMGEVSPQEATEFLMKLAAEARGSVAEDALSAAALADNVELWPQLLEIARTRDRPRDVRKSAMFWLGQAAADKALGALDDMAMDEDDEIEVREAAVFAISQRDEDEAVPTLMRIARSDAHPKIRRSAMFWLSQVDDPRVVDFFEEVLDAR